MTKAEIYERIDELSGKRFCLAMKDRWSADDHRIDAEWYNKLLKLKEMLKNA